MMTDAPELKPCPFCGGGARIYQDPSHSTAWFCGCEDWDCFGNMMWDETKTGATDKWNRRAGLSSPLGAVAPVAHAYVVNGECEQIDWGVDGVDGVIDDPELVLLYALPSHAALLAAALKLPEVVAMREALAKLRDLMCENFEDDDGNSGCGQCQDDCTGCLAHATLTALEAKP